LNGTSLVVLSACDTGVGDVSFSEGLSGLQRSLALVGARTQLLTLWPVNSVRTSDFMKQFYGRLASGKTKGEAWIETQREMIRQGLAPHLWAPFVLYGDPDTL
jgi:CHAT domain-containing protein